MASQPIIDTPVIDPRAMIRAILFNRRHDYDYSSSDSAVAFISGLLRHYNGLLPQDEQRLSTIAGIYDMETIKRLTHEIASEGNPVPSGSAISIPNTPSNLVMSQANKPRSFLERGVFAWGCAKCYDGYVYEDGLRRHFRSVHAEQISCNGFLPSCRRRGCGIGVDDVDSAINHIVAAHTNSAMRPHRKRSVRSRNPPVIAEASTPGPSSALLHSSHNTYGNLAYPNNDPGFHGRGSSQYHSQEATAHPARPYGFLDVPPTPAHSYYEAPIPMAGYAPRGSRPDPLATDPASHLQHWDYGNTYTQNYQSY